MNMAVDFEEKQFSLNDLLRIAQRRKKQFLLPAAVTLALMVLIAALWPASYRSTATILIEEQEIPQDLVRSTITGFANQQIQVITQRIMTLSNIMTIVEKYGLLDETELKRTPRTEIAEKFQKEMKLDLVSAEVMDPRFGRPMEATIAFTLAFDHRDPGIAQKVANELVNLYLNENLKTRTEKTATTAGFLKNEADALHARIRELEQQLAGFKQQNEGALPELYQYNLNVIERSHAELQDARARIGELEKRRLELQANMAQLSPYAPTELPTGEKVLNDHDRLKALESELRAKGALYSDQHPDVVRLRREIAGLKQLLGVATDTEAQARQLKLEQDRLAQLRQTYAADHPQVAQQQRVVDALASQKPATMTSSDVRADNPAYVLLDTQLKATDAEMKVLNTRIADLQQKIGRFETNLSKAPDVEQKYSELTRDLQTTTAKYQEITAKQMQASLAQNLETERKGERFNLIEPPIRPEQPQSPNRVAIILIGCLLAIVVGAACVAVVEMLDEGIRGEADLTALLGTSPLATIPYIAVTAEQAAPAARRYIALGASTLAFAALLLIIHLAYKPLDVLWYVALRKLGLG
jgi:uncharacterized protein involved in exopolysaccharide biosynthesis